MDQALFVILINTLSSLTLATNTKVASNISSFFFFFDEESAV